MSALAPFRVRSFRFQWPADLATSWAFEMETLILGWYVLVETKSVLLLTVFAALQLTGTLLGPLFGVMGDHHGHRNILCATRAVYATLATTLMILAFAGALTPLHVFVIAAVMGLVRPSDMGTRTAVVGDTMPGPQLMAAMGIQRTTQDTAKIAGALSGAGLVAALGMGPALAVVAGLYATSVLLTWKAGNAHVAPAGPAATASEPARASPWRDVRAGLAHVRHTPLLFAVMCLAFLLNLTAFPLITGLLPYVAKEIYHADQTVLGYMVAGVSSGALLGSILMSRLGGALQAARVMIFACVGWYLVLLVFSQVHHPAVGIVLLMGTGFAQSTSQVPMSTLLLRNSDARLRGRVMGIRMLAIYGAVPGLLIAGPLIAHFGYALTVALYCAFGLTFTVLIVRRWRAYLWQLDAPANRR